MKEITCINDLKKLVYPALTSKVYELESNGYRFINQDDLWDLLYNMRWKEKHQMALCDIVDDILNFNNEKIYRFFIEKKNI